MEHSTPCTVKTRSISKGYGDFVSTAKQKAVCFQQDTGQRTPRIRLESGPAAGHAGRGLPWLPCAGRGEPGARLASWQLRPRADLRRQPRDCEAGRRGRHPLDRLAVCAGSAGTARQSGPGACGGTGPAYSPPDGSAARGRAEGNRRTLTFRLVLQLSGVLLSRPAGSRIGSS